MSGVSAGVSHHIHTPTIWKQVTGGVTVIELRLWTPTNPSVSRYDWKNTVQRCNNKECFGQSLAQSREQLGVFFFSQRSWKQEAVKLFQRHPAPVSPLLCEARAGVGVWKELLFNLWPSTFTPFQSVKWVAEEDMALLLTKKAQTSGYMRGKQQLRWCLLVLLREIWSLWHSNLFKNWITLIFRIVVICTRETDRLVCSPRPIKASLHNYVGQ